MCPSPTHGLSTILDIFQGHETVANSLPLEKAIAFVILARHLKARIAFSVPANDPEIPEALPRSVHGFLCASLEIEHELAKLCWQAFRHHVWATENIDGQVFAYCDLFLRFGVGFEIGLYDMYPPYRACIDPACTVTRRDGSTYPKLLDKETSHAATVFTKDRGPFPVWTTSLYCRTCCTRYHPNYFVHDDATKRTYYGGVPKFLHVSQSVFFESSLCEVHADMMVASWTSATNCARIYNTAVERSYRPRVDWRSPHEMDCEFVWDAFFLNALLNDLRNRNEILVLQHEASSQAMRLKGALEVRNTRMAGPGQRYWNHACTKCTWFKETEDGAIFAVRATVTDGVTLGHPCCGVHDCQEPLRSQRDLFCPSHQGMRSICAVTSCSERIDQGHQTCANPEHRQMETDNYRHNGAMFQLKRRLERVKVMQPSNSLATGGDEDEGQELDEGPGVDETFVDSSGQLVDEVPSTCDGKPPEGNRRLRARFGRRRTHNEELCVTCCGVILGRATFFGSEASNGVRLFWRSLFPTKKSLPQFLFMDSNCKVLSHIHAQGDEDYFANCGLPVDVFHFDKKHKDKDEFCARWCNPVLWPDLVTPEGRWRFNSSAAEQTNAWFGGYQPIVREMRVERYNFFLDEMIQRRNEIMVKEHARRGYEPHLIPREDLLSE